MAQKHLLFVTSCRPGEEGAITAFRLDADKGSLTQTQQYTEVENPFFWLCPQTENTSIQPMCRVISTATMVMSSLLN